MNVLFHFAAGPDLAARLEALCSDTLRITVCGESDTALLARLLPETDVLWHVLQPATAAMIDVAPRLRLIQKIGVGVNTIDLEAALGRGIAVCNLPGTNARAVAELTLTLMLAALRRLPLFHAAMRDGDGFGLDPALRDGIGELGGRTVGLVGYGAVPRVLAPVLGALGCRVIYTARTPRGDAAGAFRPLNGLLEEADVVSLHLPLSNETQGIIDAAALARMRRGAVLVNTARGGLVDQSALLAALRSGHLAAAGLDVFVDEPPSADDPLLQLPNVVLTPHVGWLTTGTFDRSFALAAENCRRLAAGEPLLHRVV
ncbi:MAG: 2-hydroxyacid dehydrogenase [Acetobacteraceae bacterium]